MASFVIGEVEAHHAVVSGPDANDQVEQVEQVDGVVNRTARPRSRIQVGSEIRVHESERPPNVGDLSEVHALVRRHGVGRELSHAGETPTDEVHLRLGLQVLRRQGRDQGREAGVGDFQLREQVGERRVGIDVARDRHPGEEPLHPLGREHLRLPELHRDDVRGEGEVTDRPRDMVDEPAGLGDALLRREAFDQVTSVTKIEGVDEKQMIDHGLSPER